MSPQRLTAPKLLRACALAAVACAVALAVFPLDVEASRYCQAHAPYLTLGLFAVGLLALLARQRSVMLGAFAGSALLSVVLRSSTINVAPESTLVEAIPARSFEMLQVSTANLNDNVAAGLAAIQRAAPDLVSVQGLTPDWAEYLAEELDGAYPHQYTFEDIGLQGIGLYSSTPLGSVDSVVVGGIVHVDACYAGDAGLEELRLLAVQTLPPVNAFAYHRLRRQLAVVAEQVRAAELPTVVFGDFNSVPWSDEFYDFQRDAELLDSRRTYQSTFVKGSPQFFETPVEHIFYSPDLRCVGYQSLRAEGTYFGNGATFQDRSAGVELAAL